MNISPAMKTEKFTDSDKTWYAVYTVVRHEKVIDRYLREQDINSFLPLSKSINKWKDRKKTVYTPLFPGYIFVNITRKQMYSVLNIPNVIRFLGNSRGPIPVPENQIESVRQLLNSGLSYQSYPYMTEGRDVLITDGPLRGFKGQIIGKNGHFRLILCVDLIKRSVSVFIDVDQVELI